MARFLTIVDGVKRLVSAIAQSVGVSDAGKIVETHDNGKIHNSLINWDAPGAIGATTPAAIAGTTGNFSGNVTFGSDTVAGVNIALNSSAGNVRDINFRTAGLNRWLLRCVGNDDFLIQARNDDGSNRDTPVYLSRAVGGSILLGRPTLISDTTASTSTTTGALIVSGGLGLAGALNIGGNFSANGTSHRLGTNSSPFAVLDLNAAANSSKQLRFQTAGLNRWNLYLNGGSTEGANSGANLVLSYYNDDGTYRGDIFQANRNTGALTFGNALNASNAVITGGSINNTPIGASTANTIRGTTGTFTSATASTSTTTGALIVSGGAGISGALNVGGNITGAQFRLPALNAAPASLTATGTLGETRIASDGIYVCVGSNSWRRTLFSGAANAAAYYTYLASLSPTLLIPLEDSDGNILFDRDGADIGFYSGAYALQRPSLLSDPTARSVLLRSAGAIVTSQIFNNPNPFTFVCRFRASAAATGSFFGFGNTTDFSPSSYDRSVYLNGNTVAIYGWTGSEFNLDTSVNVRDNSPHTLAIRVSSGGTSIWIDGVQAASTASVLASNYNGYWRIGHSLVFGSRQNFAGFANGITMAGVAIFSSALSDAQIAQIHANA